MSLRAILLATASTFALAGTAAAADLAIKARPMPVAAFNWTGCYAGLSAGAARHNAKTDISDVTFYEGYSSQTLEYSKFGGAAGAQVGCNWQSRNFVFGVEADWNWLGTSYSNLIQHVDSAETSSVTNDAKGLATLRARFGFDWDGTLLYGTTGIGWINTKNHFNVNAIWSGNGLPKGGNFSSSKWTPAFVAGAGIEHMLTRNWSVRGEVLWAWANTVTAPALDPLYFEDGNTVKYTSALTVWRLGVNYRFGP
jgi:outer membrane immunogenic protein